MSKTHAKVTRKDNQDEHVHSLPNGKLTGGSLHKPAKDQFDFHSHLYDHNGVTLETSPAHNSTDHSHETVMGMTAGPQKPSKAPGKPAEKLDGADKLMRVGSQWQVRSSTGRVVATGDKAGLRKQFPDAVE